MKALQIVEAGRNKLPDQLPPLVQLEILLLERRVLEAQKVSDKTVDQTSVVLSVAAAGASQKR